MLSGEVAHEDAQFGAHRVVGNCAVEERWTFVYGTVPENEGRKRRGEP